jgi:DNA-binding response OmpR family regulator
MSDFQVILFVGRPPEESLEDLTVGFQQEAMVTSFHCPALGGECEAAGGVIGDTLPDLICLFADDLEAQGEDVLSFCAGLREQNLKYRPILIVQSGAAEEKRIQYLIQGADDILPSTLSLEEFKIRLLVHLRRNIEGAVNESTRLPGLHFASRVIQRRLNRQEAVALLVVELDHFDTYGEVYGELPSRQVLKTFAALLSRLVVVPDFISHTDEDHFLIVTHPDKAEKLASLLCRQFETVSPNLYSEKDRKQGYMISVVSDNISRRVSLMSLSIGIVSTQTQPFDSFTALFNAAQQMKTMARMVPGCSWQSDRLRLSGSPVKLTKQKPGILVLETDAALAYLLKTTLEMEGYEVDVVSGLDDARSILSERQQALNLVILDALLNSEETGLLLLAEIHDRYPEVNIICTSSLHNRQRVLQAGADLYLPKPFELSSLFSWIHRLLQESF